MIEDFARWFSGLSIPEQALAALLALAGFACLVVLADRR